MFVLPREEDTTSSMYPRPEGVQSQPASGQKKVDVVCDALRSAMESMGLNRSVTRHPVLKTLKSGTDDDAA